MERRPPQSTRTDTLFPDTTLVRSAAGVAMQARVAAALEHLDAPAALGEQGGEQGTGEAGADDGEGFGISVFQICPHTPFVHKQVFVRWEAKSLGSRFRGNDGFWVSGARSFPPPSLHRPHEPQHVRSEEHTSELQSLMRSSSAVF